MPCMFFNDASAGYDPSWICWNHEFVFFRPRELWTQRPAQTRLRGENLRLPRFDPMILCSFFATIRWTTLEKHSSKQLKVYDQITFLWYIRFDVIRFLKPKTPGGKYTKLGRERKTTRKNRRQFKEKPWKTMETAAKGHRAFSIGTEP